MDFKELYERVSPKLKMIAKSRNGQGSFIDDNDLYQEMCLYLWEKFKEGVPVNINEAYITKGCKFHLLNYLRKNRNKVLTVSIEKPLNEDGFTLKDILPEAKEPLDDYVAKKMLISEIKSNGITKREKKAFSLLLKGYTTREIGRELGISHVGVVKIKKRIVRKWQNKQKTWLPKERNNYFCKNRNRK